MNIKNIYISKKSSQLKDVELVDMLIGPIDEERAERILDLVEKNDIRDMKTFPSWAGLSKDQLLRLKAALELGRRKGAGRTVMSGVDAVYQELKHYAYRKQEHFIVVALNGAEEVLSIFTSTIGTVKNTLVHPREVFAIPIELRATWIIVAHNHPSGILEPSKDDIEITRRLCQCGDLLGIPVLDHMIITTSGYYSFAQNNRLSPI